MKVSIRPSRFFPIAICAVPILVVYAMATQEHPLRLAEWLIGGLTAVVFPLILLLLCAISKRNIRVRFVRTFKLQNAFPPIGEV